MKRFITNGDAHLHLVLARSEEGTKDGRGLSMFIYDKNDGGVDVRRIENKLGIHGSPTCELVYKNAKAELCGDRKLGLIKYVMALMNGARLGIAAQSVGLSQAAYNEGLAYAKDRKQFGKAIIEFPAKYSEPQMHSAWSFSFAISKAVSKAIFGLLITTTFSKYFLQISDSS